MEKVKEIEHKGKNIVYLDFTNGDMLDKKQEVLDLFTEAKNFISKQEPTSLLTLTNVTGLRFTMELINAFKDLTAHNKPYVKAAALVGIRGIQKMAYDSVMKVTKRNIPIFKSVKEAMDWLVEQ